MLKSGHETDAKIRELCEDISTSYVTSSSIEPEFANLTGKDMSSIKESLFNYLNVSIREFLDDNNLIEYD